MGTYLRACLSGAFVFGLAIGVLTATEPQASEIQVDDLRIQDPYINILPSAARHAPVFMTIVNESPVADRLVGVTTFRSQRSGLMVMEMHDHVMRMVPVAQFTISSNEILELNALGKFVMLMDLNGPLEVGETFTMVLEFANAGKVEVNVTVVPSLTFD